MALSSGNDFGSNQGLPGWDVDIPFIRWACQSNIRDSRTTSHTCRSLHVTIEPHPQLQEALMLRSLSFASIFVALLMTQGCATKTYGRQGTLTSYEKDTMNCREIDLELAKTRGFVDHVNKESEFSGRDVLAILGDFGIGNNMEKSAALESANKRIEQLRDLRATKKCEPGQA
ncbi:hypothetical protein [Leptothrix cholodnii]|nr:hypothetical protein [Leptothrix cholodnii]